VFARRRSGNARLPRSGNERPVVGTAHARCERAIEVGRI
jgi:hypothetical protein